MEVFLWVGWTMPSWNSPMLHEQPGWKSCCILGQFVHNWFYVWEKTLSERHFCHIIGYLQRLLCFPSLWQDLNQQGRWMTSHSWAETISLEMALTLLGSVLKTTQLKPQCWFTTTEEGRTGVDITQNHLRLHEMSKLWKEQARFSPLPCFSDNPQRHVLC